MILSSDGAVGNADADTNIKVIEELTNEGSANPSHNCSDTSFKGSFKNYESTFSNGKSNKSKMNPNELHSILKKNLTFEDDTLLQSSTARAKTSRKEVRPHMPSLSIFIDTFQKTSKIADIHEQS